MTMKRPQRSLRPDFVAFMTERDVWPAAQNFESWYRSNGNGIQNGTYGAMIQGRPVHPKFIAAFARYTRDFAPKPEENSRQAFAEFLTPCGINDLQQVSPEEIAVALCDSQDAVDYHKNGFARILDLFNIESTVDAAVQECVTPEQVATAVQYMYEWVGDDLNKHAGTSSLAAIDAAAARIKLSLPEYQQRAINWWRFDRWTVVFARGKNGPAGMSIVLPLREHVYYAVKAGKKATPDILREDLDRPSRTLLIEGVAQRDPTACAETINLSKYTASAMTAQMAALSRAYGKITHEPLRILTFGGTPTNEERLITSGFKRTGTRMPLTEVELFEKIFSWPPRTAKDLITLGIFHMLGDWADRLPRPPHGDPSA
jgi:hypothetical protein